MGLGGGRGGLAECPLLSVLTVNAPGRILISDSSRIILPGTGSPANSLTDPLLIPGSFFSQLFIARLLIFQALVVRKEKTAVSAGRRQLSPALASLSVVSLVWAAGWGL